MEKKSSGVPALEHRKSQGRVKNVLKIVSKCAFQVGKDSQSQKKTPWLLRYPKIPRARHKNNLVFRKENTNANFTIWIVIENCVSNTVSNLLDLKISLFFERCYQNKNLVKDKYYLRKKWKDIFRFLLPQLLSKHRQIYFWAPAGDNHSFCWTSVAFRELLKLWVWKSGEQKIGF